MKNIATEAPLDEAIIGWAKKYEAIFQPQISNDVAKLEEHLETLKAIKKHLDAQVELIERMICCYTAQINDAADAIKRKGK